MTGVDAHGLLREQVMAEVSKRVGHLVLYPATVAGCVDKGVMPLVEAAIAAARRDALTAAADEMFAEVEGGPGLLRPEVQAWLRQRAAEDDPIHLPGIPTCNCEGCTTYREINGEVTDERG